MVERVRSKIKQSNLPLEVLVDQVTLACTGFNYGEPSLLFPKEGGGYYNVFIADKAEFGPRPNIVIVEDQKRRGAVKWKEWYFGTLDGVRYSERKDDSFDKGIEDIIQPASKVSGFELAEKLKKFI